MPKFGDVFGGHRKQLLGVAATAAIAAAIMFGFANAAPGRAQALTQPQPQSQSQSQPQSQSQSQPQSQSQSQNTSAAPPALEYEVATIKPSIPDAPGMFMTIPGPGLVSDSFTAKNFTLMTLVRAAFGIPLGAEDSRISGASKWLDTEKYDVEAKMSTAVVDELKKLSPEESKLAQQHMLQALLADRCKLAFHRESKEFPIYSLVIAKNGPKLQESKTVATPPADAPPPADSGGRGGRGGRGGPRIMMRGRGGPLEGQGVGIANLVDLLSMLVGRPVVDKTGLTGKYDFTLQWTPDDSQAPSAFPPGMGQPPDPAGPSLFTAIQEQLGLKLESGKGPVEIIVIDHVERPSGN
ncbi:MAG: TIGR03435 family protein [Candidatus Acidiferrales bacterium]